MAKKNNAGHGFGSLGLNLDFPSFFMSFPSTKCYTLSQAISACNFKEN